MTTIDDSDLEQVLTCDLRDKVKTIAAETGKGLQNTIREMVREALANRDAVRPPQKDHRWPHAIDRTQHGRTKTGRAALGTLSRLSERLIEAYLSQAFGDPVLLPDTKLFRNRSGGAYREDTLATILPPCANSLSLAISAA